MGQGRSSYFIPKWPQCDGFHAVYCPLQDRRGPRHHWPQDTRFHGTVKRFPPGCTLTSGAKGKQQRRQAPAMSSAALSGHMEWIYRARDLFHSHKEKHKSRAVRQEAPTLLKSHCSWNRGVGCWLTDFHLFKPLQTPDLNWSEPGLLCKIQMRNRKWNVMKHATTGNLKHFFLND